MVMADDGWLAGLILFVIELFGAILGVFGKLVGILLSVVGVLIKGLWK
jgi:hypothetical protein